MLQIGEDGEILSCQTCNQLCKTALKHTKSVCDRQVQYRNRHGAARSVDIRLFSTNRNAMLSTMLLRNNNNNNNNYSAATAEENETVDDDEKECEDEDERQAREQQENANARHARQDQIAHQNLNL